MTSTLGSSYAVVIDVTHPGLRATAAAALAFRQNIFGQAAGPFITGALSYSYGLTTALTVVPAFGLLAALFYGIAAYTYQQDMGRVEQSVIVPDHIPEVSAA